MSPVAVAAKAGAATGVTATRLTRPRAWIEYRSRGVAASRSRHAAVRERAGTDSATVESGNGSLREIVFDCERPSLLARFWAAVLDGYRVRPYDEQEIARLAAIGLSPETDPTVLMDGPGPIL